MGFAVLIDILGSIIVGGFFLLTLLRFNENTTHNSYAYNGEVIVQENLVATIETLEYDLRKIGFCDDPLKLPQPSRSILYADSTTIKYLTDTQVSGNLDTIIYYLGPASELESTPNPNDRLLYKSVNGVPKSVNLGVTEFKMRYFDALGYELTPPLSVPTGISSMQVDVKVENTTAYAEDYRYAFWRQIRLASRNIEDR
ncbi:MAG: hypothetical protein ACM3U0_02030 [archaeon]